MSARLFVGNLNFSVSDEALRDAFVQVGPVERAEIVRDRYDGRSRGFGFVEMANPGDGERAVEELNGKPLAGRPMRVETATTARRGPAHSRAAA